MKDIYYLKNNALRTRDDVARCLVELLDSCIPHITKEGAGLDVGKSSAHYSNRINLFEGWSRLLWGIAPLVHGGYSWDGTKQHARGFISGVDPANAEFWGPVGDGDQRIVEMAAMSLSLLLCPETYWDPLTEVQKTSLMDWLCSCNGKRISNNNWHFFRILVNMAVMLLGRDYDKSQMDEDLKFIDSLYVSDGWYRDDVPFDYYNPFGIQFYCLVYCKYMKDLDPERCRTYKDRVTQFGRQFATWFSDNGASIPFGRSQTYRFAASCFFSACAFAGLEVLPWGVMKGIVLRNLRFWFSKPILDNAGMLTIGYAYPSLVVADEYNAPGSPYWGLKTFLILALGEDHPFWASEEKELPIGLGNTHMPALCSIIQRSRQGNVTMLSAGQYPAFEMNNAAEKYSKFAYSTDFGFSVSIGPYTIEKASVDNMLLVSECDDYWRPRRRPEETRSTENQLYSRWKPFDDVEIETWIIPSGDWHVRVHKVKAGRNLWLREGGFGIMRYNDYDVYKKERISKFDQDNGLKIETDWGISAIVSISGGDFVSFIYPMPNTNLMFSTQITPVISSSCRRGEVLELVTLVGAGLFRDGMPSIMDCKPEVEYKDGVLSIDGCAVDLI